MSTNATLAHGRSYLAIPGPSVIPDEVLNAMHRASPNIYEGPLIDMMPDMLTDLRRVARTQHHVAIYISNGHGVWEASIANVVAPGEKVLVLATGSFGMGWGGMAEAMGIEVDYIDFGKRDGIDLMQAAEALVADKDHKIKAVLAVHVDTSTSVRNDMEGLRKVLDAAGHPALLMADCIASLGCDVFEMDAWGVDVMVAACQKGLMVPPGVGFVFFNDKAAEQRNKMVRVSRYWDWQSRANPDVFFEYFGGTAPTNHLFGLRKALDMIHAEGIENVWARHATLARAIWAACDAWGHGDGELEMNIADPGQRSTAVTSLRLLAPHATELRNWVETNLGLTLGIGLGIVPQSDPAWHGYFRMGHMGHVNGQMIMGALGGIQAGLTSLEIPHGSGGLEAAADVIATHSVGTSTIKAATGCCE